MKRTVFVLAAFVMAVILIGCSNNDGSAGKDPNIEPNAYGYTAAVGANDAKC